ncbi:hypothetical protein A2272_04775 [Candidatus Peregrinibacteria bacterium RIFOXYA12_FULL_33_12]|nr:MAG: hypothetical protein A2272_04775 [Candidatus Peregrinibacteria bacterium RIFOXYA12_FULL_33_12]OGJ51839.1 MAG: hypothetical protein A2307_05180 [Candidatus Peregrinibacteria bacterium RIFOXYB2_FULL_33_20]
MFGRFFKTFHQNIYYEKNLTWETFWIKIVSFLNNEIEIFGFIQFQGLNYNFLQFYFFYDR